MEPEGGRPPSPPPPPPPPSPTPHLPDPDSELTPSPSTPTELISASDPPGEEEQEEGTDEKKNPSPSTLSDDLRDKIVRQVEYYFSDENLPTDKFLLKYVKRNKEGFVPIAVIATFRRMQKLVQDLSLIEAALRTSSQLAVSSNGKKVKRSHPLLVTESDDGKSQSCTVLVENLPDNFSVDSIQKTFGTIGSIKNISILGPHSAEESAMSRKLVMAIGNKVHALVEYETVEAAESAVATLNDEKNWRNGLRVELLVKRMRKYGFNQRGYKEVSHQKPNDTEASCVTADGQDSKAIDHDGKMAEKEEEEHFPSDKAGRRTRNRRKGHPQQKIHGLGHGHNFSTGVEGVNKPPPGPRMPDGTRGFTMGRGKPAS